MRTKEASLLFLELLLTLIILASSTSDEFSINAGYDLGDISTATEGLALEVELFEQWRAEHGKVYSDPAEKSHRFRNFLKNLAYVREKNTDGSSGSVVGLNVFADLSNEEYSEMYLTRMPTPGEVEETGRRSVGAMEGKVEGCQAPNTIDWREKGAVTGVKYQDTCGSCWAFASTGAMEGINAITTGKLINLSVQELVDCDWTNTGCQKGHMTFAYKWVVRNGGIAAEADYPYVAKKGKCNDAAKDRFKAVKIDGFKTVPVLQQDALLCAVAKQPVGVMISAKEMDFQLYTGGIYEGKSCTNDPRDVDHAVLIVGYGSNGGADYWIVKNSYSTKWGLNGYGYIKRDTKKQYGVCAINYYASYPTKLGKSTISHFGQSLQNNGDVAGETTKKKEIQLRGIKPTSNSVVEES